MAKCFDKSTIPHRIHGTGIPWYIKGTLIVKQLRLVGGWTNPSEKYAKVKLVGSVSPPTQPTPPPGVESQRPLFFNAPGSPNEKILKPVRHIACSFRRPQDVFFLDLLKRCLDFFSQMVVFHGDESHGRKVTKNTLKTNKSLSTPLKFNMEPENKPLEKEIPFGNHHFQVPC